MLTELTLGLMSFLVGVLIGLTSMGGAALMTPFLILVAGIRPVAAVGTDLAYSAIAKILGAGMHWRQKTVDVSTALRLACGSVPGGMLGVLTIVQLRRVGFDVDQWVRHAIGIALVSVALVMLIRSFLGNVPDQPPRFLRDHRTAWTVSWGALVGFAVGMTSVGSGSLIAPFLLLLYANNPARMVGTDVFHSALLVSATAILHSKVGYVEWQILPILLAGSIPGVLLGSYFAPRLPARTLRIGLGAVLLATGMKLV